MEKSKNFNNLKTRYEMGFCTKEQLAKYVEIQNPNYSITKEEYEEITGEPYLA